MRNLLHLARTGQAVVKRTVDLVAVAADVVEQFEPLAVERGLSLTIESSDPVVVLGDSSQLSIVASDLPHLSDRFFFGPTPHGGPGITVWDWRSAPPSPSSTAVG